MAFTYKHRRILYVLIILTLAFIWGNSLVPGDVSGKISDFFKEIMLSVFPWLSSGGGVAGAGGLIRKLGHFSEFLILGVELSFFFRPIKTKAFLPLLACGLFTAVIDETIQLFIPGRAGLVTDVWIDFGGFFAGTVIYAAVWIIKQKKRAKKPD